MINPTDIRIDCVRQAIQHWRASCRMTHLPTGLSVEFEEAWDAGKKPRDAALKELERLVAGRAN